MIYIIKKGLKFTFCLWISGYRQAVNRAGKRVVFIDRYEDRTVYHDFFSQYGSSRLFVQQKVTFKKYIDNIWEKKLGRNPRSDRDLCKKWNKSPKKK